MIFFTRELYLGVQPKSGWERKARNEWQRRRDIYHRYYNAIAPMLPAAVRRLCKQTLHDGVIREARLTKQELSILVDATNALGGFRGRQVRLTFRGVKQKPMIAKLAGRWWLYEEAHLSRRAKFNFQVLFDREELEIEADELRIEASPILRR